ncbi:type IV secretion system protein, partial [Rickettsiales bacterium]|nr:type IV secretion system protein [Rickettsiales bacterium]
WIDKNLTELLQYRKYREYVYRGAEREDRSGNNRWDLTASSIEAAIDSTARIGIDMKYCIDPTKEYNVDHGDIMKAYYVPGSNANGGYKFYDKLLEERGGNQFGPFAVQKYYYRGTTSSEFNCGKYLQEPRGKVRSEVNGSAGTKKGVWNIMGSNDPDMNQMRQIYRDAYDCCMRKKHGSICVEYDSDYSPDSDSDYDNDDVFDGGDYYVEPNHNIDPDLEDIKEPVYNDNYRICNAEEVCSFGAIDTGNILPLEFDSEYITTTDRDIDSNANNLLCAHTISLCPFDFNIGGATAICNHVSPTDLDIDLDSDQMCSSGDMTATNIGEPGNNNGCQKRENIGTCDNYCQMLNHCVIVDSSSDYSNISINSPYFDKSCFDFKGVSKYSGSSSHWRAGEVTTLSLSDHDSLLPVSSSTINLFPDDITRLTSPIAQCVRETIKNVFLNKAGHTRCLEGNNFGNYDTCPTGQYKWLKGQDLENITNDEGDRVYFSIFKFIQDKLYDIVQVFLILYVMMFGLQILMSEKIIPRDKILNNCLKLGIVLYFATGNAWQTYFFDVVYYISVTFGNIILDLQNASLAMDDSSVGSEEMNRCYFDPALYSSEMQYVSLWDTLDCKLSQYLGLAPGLTSGNLAILIIAGFFTGSYGIYFASLLFTFAIQFFQIIYLTLYIFLSTSIAVIMLIFISPIIMVALLFEKTKTMFNEWLKQLLESATQIIILFSFVSLTIFLFDYFFTGSAKFENNKINCECSCKVKNGLADGSTEKYFIHGGYKKCGTVRGNVVDDSVAAGAIAGGVAGAGAGLMVGGPIGMAAGAAAGAAGGSVAGSVAGGSVEGATTITCKDEFNGGNLDATKDENNILIVDDQRIVINCENIYREGLCNQRDGFEIMDPKADSLICMMRIGSESVGKTSNLAIFGVAAPVLNILLAPDRVITLILTLVKIVMITYIIKIMTSRIGTIASVMWGGKPLPSSISGADIGIKKAFNRTKNLASKTQQLANRGAGKKATEFAKSRSGNSGSSGGESPPKSGGNDSSSF